MRSEVLLASIADRSGIFDVYALMRRLITKSQVAILMYHRVCSQDDGWSPRSLVVHLRDFQMQMQYLTRNYRILSLQQLVERILTRKPLSEKAAVITFDDGYKDVYTCAYPTLKKYDIPATIFLATGYITNPRPFWWDNVAYDIHHTTIEQLSFELGNYSLRSKVDRSYVTSRVVKELKKLPTAERLRMINELSDTCQVKVPSNLGRELLLSWEDIREMHGRNISFGAHSVSHPILTHVPIEGAEAEIVQSKKDIEERLGVEVTAFSYPNGDFNAEIAGLIRKSGFSCAVSSVQLERLTSSSDSVYGLNRIGASECFGIFKGKICGLWGDIQACNALN